VRQEASRLFEVAEPGERAVVEHETSDAMPLVEAPAGQPVATLES
jgi:hypothetical protein